MNILDENIPESQRRTLRRMRVTVRQIGHDTARKGIKDDELIALLHQLNRPTFFTLDGGFYDRRLCHQGYCLVHLEIEEELVAEYVRRLLRHRLFRSRAKRMGMVVRLSSAGVTFWRMRGGPEGHLAWQ
jgi:hypothetical protein